MIKIDNLLNKKIHVIFDTNIIHQNIDWNNPKKLRGSIKKFSSELVDLKIQEFVTLVIPEIVLEESRQQFIEEYLNSMKLLASIKNKSLPGMKVDLDDSFNIEAYSKKVLSDIKLYSLTDYNVVTNMEMMNIDFSSVLNRAISKRPPFEGKNSKSDKGFKDAVLWESIISYKMDRPDLSIILLTKDRLFNDELAREYYEIFEDNIIIFHEEDNLSSFLISISKEDSSLVRDEIDKSKAIRTYIYSNFNNDLLIKYKYWLEDLEAYGPGITIMEIMDMNFDVLTAKRYNPKHSITGDYYGLLRIQAKGSQNERVKFFESEIHIDIKYGKHISFDIIGLTLKEVY